MTSLQLQLLALVACISLVFWGGCRVERSRWEDQMAQSAAQVAKKDSTIWRLRNDSASLATKHSTDTLTLTKWMTRWKEVTRTDTLPGKTDTIRLTTTQIIRIADSTIGACSTALTSCQGLRLNAESRALTLDGQNADLRKLLARPKPLVTPSRMVTLGLLIFAATKVF